MVGQKETGNKLVLFYVELGNEPYVQDLGANPWTISGLLKELRNLALKNPGQAMQREETG